MEKINRLLYHSYQGYRIDSNGKAMKGSVAVIEMLAKRLQALNWTMSTAESCTGGMVAAKLTNLAGSSAWFERGYVTYSNEAKQQDLNVNPQSLAQFGAVSEEVAGEMAYGCLTKVNSNASLSVTGIAGPTGGSEKKPVGTVCFGWCINGDVHTKTKFFEGDRAAIRMQACEYVLKILLEHIDKVHD